MTEAELKKLEKITLLKQKEMGVSLSSDVLEKTVNGKKIQVKRNSAHKYMWDVTVNGIYKDSIDAYDNADDAMKKAIQYYS
jgi:hypothetical protein